MKKTFLGLGTIASIGVVIPMTISCGTKDEDTATIDKTADKIGVTTETYENKAAFEKEYAKEYAKKIFVLGNRGKFSKVTFEDFKNNAVDFYNPIYEETKDSKENDAKELAAQNGKVILALLDVKKIAQKENIEKFKKLKASFFGKMFSEKKFLGVGVTLSIWKTSLGDVYTNIDFNISKGTDTQKNYEDKLSAIEKALKS